MFVKSCLPLQTEIWWWGSVSNAELLVVFSSIHARYLPSEIQLGVKLRSLVWRMRLLEKPFGPWKPLTFNPLLFKQGPRWLSKALWEGSLNGIFVFPKHPSPAVCLCFFFFLEVRIWVSVGKLVAGEWASYWTAFTCDMCKLLIKYPRIIKWRRLEGTSGDLWSSSGTRPVGAVPQDKWGSIPRPPLGPAVLLLPPTKGEE